MRLLVWASSYGQTIGGGPVLAPLLMAALARRGHEIVVLTDRRPPTLPAEEILDGVRVVRPPFSVALAGDAALCSAIRRRVAALKRELPPQLVYIFSSGYGEIFHHETHAAAPAPLVVTLHDSFAEERYRPRAMVGRNLRAAAWTTACSVSALETARRHVPEIVPISSAILNALPAPGLPIAPPRFDPPQLLYAGRLVRKKGVDILLAAFAMLRERFPALRLTIAGDGEEEAALRAEAARLGVAERIAFVGSVAHDDVFRLMAGASVVVMPSRIEPFGLVALEAALAARPIVASAVDGLPEVVVDGRTGLLVPPDDAPALAEAVASLIEAPGRAWSLGRAARDRALESFRWDRFVDVYEELFRRMARP